MKNKFKKENPDKKKRKELSQSTIKNNPGKIDLFICSIGSKSCQ